jgi:predicted ATP-binding protein involved in virulence
MITFNNIKWKNFLSYGNYYSEIKLDNNNNTLLKGPNGSGKCNRGSTLVDIEFENEKIRKAFEDFIEESSS